MPNQFGGDQLDLDYAPHTRKELNTEEKQAIKEIRENSKSINSLDENIARLNAEKGVLFAKNAELRKKCRHQNTEGEKIAYSWIRVCVDCGAMCGAMH